MKAKDLVPFDKAVLFAELDRFKVTQNVATRKVITYRKDDNGKDQKIAEYQPGTKHYQVVDFGKVAKAFINQLEGKMEIKKMLNPKEIFKGGIQEMRVYGEDFKIGKDEYTQQAAMLSSTNGLRKFAIFAGIFRYICSNGAYSALTNSVVYSVRHYKSNENLHKAMTFEFGNLEEAFDGMKAAIEKLQGKTIKLSALAKAMIEKDGKNGVKFQSFLSKLVNSKTDKIENITSAQKKKLDHLRNLKVPKELLKISPVNDMSIDAYKAFQCYTELFHGSTADIIQKETDKVLVAIGA